SHAAARADRGPRRRPGRAGPGAGPVATAAASRPGPDTGRPGARLHDCADGARGRVPRGAPGPGAHVVRPGPGDRRGAGAHGGGWLAEVVLGTVALTLLGRVLTLPWEAWSESVRRRYGLSTRSWGGWAVDVAKSYGVGLAITLVVLLLVMGLARWQPERWWA